jgi:hypothetical protein
MKYGVVAVGLAGNGVCAKALTLFDGALRGIGVSAKALTLIDK